MPYELGIDLGTTYSAAAVHRDGRISVVTLGNRAASVPSVVLLREDGDILTGEAASRRAAAEPDRVAREFKRRLGDPTPLILGSTPYSAEALTAKLLRWVIDAVSAREGEAPRAVALTHPANWGTYKRDLLVQAIRLAGLEDATLISEPEAAAIHYSSLERVEAGTLVAVYDLGGGTFDSAVLRKRGDDAFDILGQPEGIERLGGIDFDEAIFRYVIRAVGDPIQALDPNDAAANAALARLREECVEAKEALSSDTEATIPVLLPNLQTEVRLTRGEFEAMVRPTLSDTIDALRRALRSANVEASDLDKVLLVGGSSRIPIVAQMVSAELDRPVAVDTDPKFAVASGAALAAARASAVAGVAAVVEPEPEPEPLVTPVVAAAPAPAPAPMPVGAEPAVRASTASPASASRPSGRRKLFLAVGGLAAVAAIAVVVPLTGRGDGDDEKVTLSNAEPDTTDTTEEGDPGPGESDPASVGSTPYAEIIGVRADGETYAVQFAVRNYQAKLDAMHVHFFWDVIGRETAGSNGEPEPGEWLAYDGSSPMINEMFRLENRPEGAKAICALVGNAAHEIADVDGDGEKDPDSGNCWDLPTD